MNNLKKTLYGIAIAFASIITGTAQPVTVSESSANNYIIDVKATSTKYKLVWNSAPDSWSKAQAISIKASPETVVLASAHPILKLKDKKETFYAAPRGIMLKGAANFRDLGGYTTTDGHQVKWGKIYRSADISKLIDDDVKVLQELNIKMVCDLRGEQEVATAPDKLPVGAERILLSAGSENVGGAASYMKYMKNPASADSMMTAFYTRTDHLAKKYKPMFDQLLALETDKALMFHCTAGKDRTGVGAALILYSLGVDEKTIFQDYELTNEFRKQSNEQYIKMLTAQGLPEASARSMMAAKPEYLRAAFDSINKTFGSMDAFLEKQIGLDKEKINALRAKFLY
jgi:protein-tyrosine phosphatase